MSPIPSTPLILTLTLDRSSSTFLTSLRKTYFPPHRNHLSAHLTLFHAIPAHRFPELESHLNHFCQRPGFDVWVESPKAMGNRGVMVNIRSKPKGAIEGIHRSLLSELKRETKLKEDGLTNQDLMRLVHPHVTILNKAEKEEDVHKCLEEVKGVFEGMEGGEKKGRAVGFEVWEYLGGPWKSVKKYHFKGETEQEVEGETSSAQPGQSHQA